MKLADLKRTGTRIHLLGIGGIGVSALARMLAASGISVSGCDVRPSSLTEQLVAEGIDVLIGHDPAHLKNCDVVVYSTAVPSDNTELNAARASGAAVLHRSELLSLLVAEHEQSVGVTGTNGKGTVSSMITWILECAGLSPSWYIGAICGNLGTNARQTASPFLVAELDESDGSVRNIHPRYALINNLELDHLNYYTSLEHAVATLEEFCSRLAPGARCFFNIDDPGARMVAAKLPDVPRTSFGLSADADFRYAPVNMADGSSSFDVFVKHAPQESTSAGNCLGRFELAVPGSYNIENAIGAIAVASTLGVSPEIIRKALASFSGLENRYTVLHARNRRLVKDYMSHPTGMRKVLQTARLAQPKRVVAVFKPYRYTMIRYHADNYCKALALADEVIVTTMWAGGEEPIPGVDTGWLVDNMASAGLNVRYVREMNQIADYLESTSKEGDSVVFFGGQDLFEIADEVARRLHRRES